MQEGQILRFFSCSESKLRWLFFAIWITAHPSIASASEWCISETEKYISNKTAIEMQNLANCFDISTVKTPKILPIKCTDVGEIYLEEFTLHARAELQSCISGYQVVPVPESIKQEKLNDDRRRTPLMRTFQPSTRYNETPA